MRAEPHQRPFASSSRLEIYPSLSEHGRHEHAALREPSAGLEERYAGKGDNDQRDEPAPLGAQVSSDADDRRDGAAEERGREASRKRRELEWVLPNLESKLAQLTGTA
jgi:hypothetical protein